MKFLGMTFGKSASDVPQPHTMTVNTDDGQLMSFALPYSYTNPQTYERLNPQGFINFGPDNLLPQTYLTWFNSSPLHSALITKKKTNTIGNGFTTDLSTLQGMQLVEYNQVLNFFDEDCTLEESLEKFALDYFINGQMMMEVTWDETFTKIIKRRRIHPERIRYEARDNDYERITGYQYCFDWAQRGRYQTKRYVPFDPNDKKNRVQLLVQQIYTPGQKWYPLPTYTPGANFISLHSQIGEFLRTNIELSLAPSYALKFYREIENPEKKDVIRRQIEAEFAGARNAGRAMVFFSKNRDTAPDIEAITPSSLDKQFNVTADQVVRNISVVHLANPVLFSLEQAGNLGNGTDLPYAINNFNNDVVIPAQKDIERFVNKIFRLSGLPNINFKLNQTKLLPSA